MTFLQSQDISTPPAIIIGPTLTRTNRTNTQIYHLGRVAMWFYISNDLTLDVYQIDSTHNLELWE